MWTDTKGMKVIDFILEGTTAVLEGNVITAEKYEINKIEKALKNSKREGKYTVKEREHGKITECYSDVNSDVYIYEDGYIQRTPNMRK